MFYRRQAQFDWLQNVWVCFIFLLSLSLYLFVTHLAWIWCTFLLILTDYVCGSSSLKIVVEQKKCKKKKKIKLTEKGRPKINSHCHILHCMDHAPNFIRIPYSLFNNGHNDFPLFLKIFPLFGCEYVCVCVFKSFVFERLLHSSSVFILRICIFFFFFFFVRLKNVVSLVLSLSMLHCAKIAHKRPNVVSIDHSIALF